STLILALALGLVASLALAGVAMAAETTLTADLAGGAATDDDGSGTATVVLDPDAGTACWTFSVENIDPVTVSHIHEGAEGTDGGVVVDLDVDGFDGSSEGCNDAADAATLQAIIDEPAGYYVNVHNEAFPGGAIRGQLAAEVPNTALPASGPPVVPLGMLAVAIALAIGVRTVHATRVRP
ncbi:MAG: CHRD domain-containing protein, partial [Candidatus Limnocylindria bacterium]